MRTILLYMVLCLAATTSLAQGIRISEVNPDNQTITIINFGLTGTDIANFRLCSLFDYDGLSAADVTIVSGDLFLDPNESVTLSWNTSGMDPAGSDLGLYFPVGAFTMPASMVDFVQWGSPGNGREPIADAAGIWAAGTFITGSGPYEYIGDGSENGVASWQNVVTGGQTNLVINEVDSDNTGIDTAEFIELYGDPNESLDGLVIVFINGNNNSSYYAQDLDGFSLNDQGFFLMANAGVSGADVTFPDNSLQNGPDAVAVYFGNAEDWENGTEAVADNLIDMIVYGTADADDLELLALLNPGQPQVDEWSNGFTAGGIESNARVPDGGTQLNKDSYVQQAPTPGFSNVIECAGGQIETSSEETSVVACINESEAIIEFTTSSTAVSANYVYVITDEQNSIIQVLAESSYDFSLETEEGTCRVWGLSYTGALDAETLEPGDDATAVSGDGCLSLSSNFIEVSKEDCTPASCDAGDVDSDQGTGSILVCLDDEADMITFNNTSSTPEANYIYLITNFDNLIIDSFSGDSYDFNTGEENNCRVWGFSYTGTLSAGSLDPGMSALDISTDGDCTSLSANFITVVKQECVVEGGCSDIFISEYLEGSSFNKAIELYNPTDATVDLSEYQMLLYPNGSLVGINPLNLSGTLGPGEVFVISNSQASPIIQNQTDVNASVANFNGNDALELLHNGIVIDVIGTVGENPETEVWTVGTGATAEFTLVRKIEVTQGTDSWVIGADQWNVFPQDYFTSLGNHTAFPCVQTPQITFTASSLNIAEDAGTASFSVQGFNLDADLDITISLVSATATEGDDYILTLPIQATVIAGSTDPLIFSIDVVDDLLEEPTENIIIALTNDSGVEVNIGILTLNIIDNDQPIELVDIIIAAEINTEGVAVNVGNTYEIRGIVHGLNLRPGGLQFTLIDDTDGIGIFSAADDFGYIVQEGDSIHVIGEVDQFNGLAQIVVEELSFISSDNEIDQPVSVLELNEDTESHIVRLDCVSIVDLAEWAPVDPGFNVTVTDGTNEYIMRIDADVDLFNMAPPIGSFSVAGIGGQFDSSSPYLDGYQLLPRYADDIVAGPNSEFELNDGGEGACISFLNGQFLVDVEAQFDGADSYSWTLSIGDDDFSSEGQQATITGTTSNTNDVVVTLIVESAGCSITNTITFCGDYVGVEEYTFELLMYPNPVTSNLIVESSVGVTDYILYNNIGQIVRSQGAQNAVWQELDLSDLAPGVYMLQVNTEYGSRTKRIVKQ